MRKLNVYNFITLNGFFKGQNGDLSWHQHGQEEGEYAAKSSGADNILLFGRVTYEMMASWWPTPMARQSAPELADNMNKAQKIVFSKTLKKADWVNTTVLNGDLIDEVRKLKATSPKDMTILGSGTIVSQLADAGLIDSFQIMIDPVALGNGTPIFNGLQNKLEFKLVDSHVYKSGTILASYERK